MKKTRVWDLPTRVFHWSLLVSVVAAVVTIKIGGDAIVWHMRLGFFITSLLLWRLVWGLVGGHYSRFVNFIYSPKTLLAYLRGQSRPEASVGHNPLGAGSVFALLAVLLAQVASGWVADDEISNTGPLVRFVSSAWSLGATAWHKDYGQWLMLALVGLHVAAIVFYLVKKKDNLIEPMISGDKSVVDEVPASRDDRFSRLSALALWMLCAAAVAGAVMAWG